MKQSRTSQNPPQNSDGIPLLDPPIDHYRPLDAATSDHVVSESDVWEKVVCTAIDESEGRVELRCAVCDF